MAMDVVAAAFDSERDADDALQELSAALGLPAGGLEKGLLGSVGSQSRDRFVVAGPIPSGQLVRAASIIRRHHGRIVTQVTSSRT